MKRIKRAIVVALVKTCDVLDRVPTVRYWDGRWHYVTASCWGCLLGFSRWSDTLDERWGTGVWSPIPRYVRDVLERKRKGMVE